ncbi:MAG: DUF4127 family protein [Spirulina sp. SIO3F2]|nr:DUF4127 family protein [Spirulina sp. SIO3F2]
MTTIYLPLDERPCNWLYPQMLARLQWNFDLNTPSKELLGQKKKAAQIDVITQWLLNQISHTSIAIVSLEMLVYGGLLPSRLHHDSVETLLQRLEILRELKVRRPNLKILASNLIMRTPRYSSSEEEPDYYEQWGQEIFTWGWLTDKKQRVGLTDAEQSQLAQIDKTLPVEYLTDYRDRRAKNLEVNKAAIALVKSGVIDFLAIPQDDCARYGFTALDQQVIVQQIRVDRLQSKIHLYPGADEVGCTLLARADGYYGDYQHQRRKVYVLYSSVCSEQIVPLYEDRPLGESVKAHILAAGAQMVHSPQEADLVLAINTAGQVMQEAWDQDKKDITYNSYRNLNGFVEQIKKFAIEGPEVAIADVAFANGGETELIHLLDDAQILTEIVAYGGWNTCCNTIGSILGAAILAANQSNSRAITHTVIYHLLEDWLYQAIVRQDIIHTYLPTIGASYYDFQGHDQQVADEIARRLLVEFRAQLRNSFTDVEVSRLAIALPWQRMFEIGMDLELKWPEFRDPLF